MSILIDKKTRVVIQGITGKEGARAEREMMRYGTPVLAGVTPGKGGMKTSSGTRVYDFVAEAVRRHPAINTSLITVPAPFVCDAALEAICADIPLIVILSEGVPVFDTARLLSVARLCGARIIGPSSVGIISPGRGKIGSIGSSESGAKTFSRGPAGVISKSGGMASEISHILTKAGIGQSAVVGIGGDLLIGSDMRDLALLFERDPDTRLLVVFGEVGGEYEVLLADAMRQGFITKPVVALIGGYFAEKLPHETMLGHAGAIVGKGRTTARYKAHALKQAGAHIAETPEDIAVIARKILGRRKK
ncbi:MAG: hypothetical protein A3I44_03715 [Candidatus Sungbacteria bacterium RIFCSPLOWO2_02_FULL_51_17]|uniref:CoA-binding domain-containing protein n=1 Tax=Candidatus Sungbacteria bacterium RIFCSPHIGHO2_02_FULL_51_29 TaxID=1802273 RepID=A0A1G2KR09_9BACT|nr:MAG: hypothetical protein A2676_03495 [Candidatus Sungbacteria bacterium RIFCSPHIGHO2_01_FULL_51_22]OHA01820.1 MAG: hypothetical protein A3C16_05900 [Candidatus Sungbacteria bacterium RIFCSPHIGHO2_02_FULL_51_29]OHA10495.1 MAG: hypothetical protein A3I44_03715 [Candidatus Sungbacteria bacterium RIFCSPLOWO2_02_FULL_51_17]